MKAADEIDQLASVGRSIGEQYAPYVDDLIEQIADALRATLPDIPNDQLGAVLLVAADKLAKANADRAHTISAVAMTNAMTILGERLYSNTAG